MNELALFAGAGGGILGGRLLGWRTVCAVELDAYARRVLLARQADGCLDRFPIWDDVTTFDGRPWRGRVDVVSGGFPCQDISAAGRGAGLDGQRSGLWAEMARIISEVQPAYVWVENSPMLTSRGLDRVLWDLAAMGFDAQWGVVSAADAGAPHKRERMWVIGWNANGINNSSQQKISSRKNADSGGNSKNGILANAAGDRRQPGSVREGRGLSGCCKATCVQWDAEPDVGRVAHGVANRVDRLRAIGNGQVPAVVRLAWQLLSGG